MHVRVIAPVLALASVIGMFVFAAAPAGANGRPDLVGQLPPRAHSIYGGVQHNQSRPHIGPIDIRRQAGRSTAVFTVGFPGDVARRRDARVRGVTRLVVAKGSEGGGSQGVVQSASRVNRISASGGRIHYAIPLSGHAVAWLRSHPKERTQLLWVEAQMRVDVDGDGIDDHVRGASATQEYSQRRSHRGSSSSTEGASNLGSADNTIYLELRNLTKGPIHNVSMPVTCMYQDGNEGSNLQLFNAVQSATISAGGSIGAKVAADGDIFDSPELMFGEEEGKDLMEGLDIAADVVGEFIDAVPFLGEIKLATELANNCENNASVFMFAAAQAKSCPAENPNCNLSTVGGWLMSLEEGNARPWFRAPIDSVYAAAQYQLATGDNWGTNLVCPVCNFLKNPTSLALYPLALRWATHVPQRQSAACEEKDAGEFVGDHGLSWIMALSQQAHVAILEVYESGEFNGWSGSSEESPVAGNPKWSQQYPTSYCPT